MFMVWRDMREVKDIALHPCKCECHQHQFDPQYYMVP